MSLPLLALLAALTIGIVLAKCLVAGRFSCRVGRLRHGLLMSQPDRPGRASSLPPIVAAFAHRNGAHLDGPRVVRLTQTVEMRLKPDAPFFALKATQDSGTRVPGFVWDARGRMAGLVPIRVADSLVDGTGQLDVRIAAAMPVARAIGPAVDKGEAMRFLAELPWNPDAILGADNLTWCQLDPTTVEVAMATTGGTARIKLGFDAAGDIVSVSADDRPRRIGARDVPTAWIGRFSDYRRDGRYRWPRKGHVAWLLPEGEFVYWHGQVDSLAGLAAPPPV